MDQESLEATLSDLNLGAVRYFDQLDSTNNAAARWVEQGAPNMALVVADEQTAGRGRVGRKWYTPPGSALAFSLILYPEGDQRYVLSRLTALGAVAVSEALRRGYGLQTQIKWPNDVLVERRKVCGVLAEAQWSGGSLEAVVLGIGINVSAGSIEGSGLKLANEKLNFPAAALEQFLHKSVEREALLKTILASIKEWLGKLGTQEFLQTWEARLAFRGEWVQIVPNENSGEAEQPVQEGKITGLAPDGALKLRISSGETITVQVGEMRLRPIESATG